MKKNYHIIAVTIIFVLFAFNMTAATFNSELPRGVIYQIEIGPLSEELPSKIADKFSFITVNELPDGTFKYNAGNFTDYESASIIENTIRFHGFSSAVVVAFFSGKSISIADAYTLQNNQNYYEELFVLGESPSPDFNNPEGFAFNYSVYMDVNSSNVVDKLLETTYDMKLEVNPQGGYLYYIGHISRMEEAKEILQRIREEGDVDAFLVAYFNDERISTIAAIELERKFDENMAAR